MGTLARVGAEAMASTFPGGACQPVARVCRGREFQELPGPRDSCFQTNTLLGCMGRDPPREEGSLGGVCLLIPVT